MPNIPAAPTRGRGRGDPDVGNDAAPDTAFVASAAHRRVDQLQEALAEALMPAMGVERPDRYTHVAWMTAKLLRFLVKAATVTDPAERVDALAEVDVDAADVRSDVRELLAGMQTLAQLAQVEDTRRVDAIDEHAVVDQAELAIALPGDGTPAQVRVWLEDGRVRWASPQVALAEVDGQRQLAVAAALADLGAAITRALPDTGADSARPAD